MGTKFEMNNDIRSLDYFVRVKLLTKHHLEFLRLKGGCRDSSESIQNATLLEITCCGSNVCCKRLGGSLMIKI